MAVRRKGLPPTLSFQQKRLAKLSSVIREGRGIPTSGATRLTRLHGLAGGIAAIVNLYVLGFFQRPVKHMEMAR